MTGLHSGSWPWRQVTGSTYRTGRGNVLGPATSRRARWWVLTLSCGHEVERSMRYQPLPPGQRQRGGPRKRDVADALPVPERIRCELCP